MLLSPPPPPTSVLMTTCLCACIIQMIFKFLCSATDEKARIMSSLDRKQVTEKTLALGLSAAVNQHDAEAAKEESAAAGRGTHARQVRDMGLTCGGLHVALSTLLTFRVSL